MFTKSSNQTYGTSKEQLRESQAEPEAYSIKKLSQLAQATSPVSTIGQAQSEVNMTSKARLHVRASVMFHAKVVRNSKNMISHITN
jgi:hypothetical protein